MRSANTPARARFRILAVPAALPMVALALLPASGVAGLPLAYQPSDTTVAATVASPSRAPAIQLAGNRKRDSDDDFDPYGKDDPTNRKWGAAAGLGGNRYGGLNTRGDGKEKKGKNYERDEREPRQPRGDDDRGK